MSRPVTSRLSAEVVRLAVKLLEQLVEEVDDSPGPRAELVFQKTFCQLDVVRQARLLRPRRELELAVAAVEGTEVAVVLVALNGALIPP